jgi:DNA ligase (NAD+)
MDIEEIGPAALDVMYEAGNIRCVADMLEATQKDYRTMFGPGMKANKIFKNISVLKEVPLWKFLCGMGIPELGKTTSKLLAKECKSLDLVNTYARENGTTTCFEHIKGIGEKTSRYVVKGLWESKEMQKRLQETLTVLPFSDNDGKLKGQSFCLTGSLPSGRKRKEIENLIKLQGGAIKSVSKGLTYLVQADATSTTNKTKNAAKHGVEIIDETKLNEILG